MRRNDVQYAESSVPIVWLLVNSNYKKWRLQLCTHTHTRRYTHTLAVRCGALVHTATHTRTYVGGRFSARECIGI